PSSRANFRTDGLACAPLNDTLTSTAAAGRPPEAGGWLAAGVLAADASAAAGAAGISTAAGAADCFSASAARCPPLTSSVKISAPFDTRSPFFNATDFTTPALVEGTSIVAFSVS